MRYTKHVLPLALALSLVSSGAPVFAEDTTSTIPVVTPAPAPRIDLACIAAAVDTREVAIAASIDSLYVSQKAALSARRTALANAWKIPERQDRNNAIIAAWKAFRADHRKAALAHRGAVNDAWKQYKTDRKACMGANEAGGEPRGAQEDMFVLPLGLRLHGLGTIK